MQFNHPRITLHDQHFSGVHLGVKLELSIRLFTRTDDLREEVRPPLPVGSVVDCRVRVEVHHDIRTPVVVLPLVLAVADVDPGRDATDPRFFNNRRDRQQQLELDILVFVVRHRWHNNNPLPNFLEP